VNEQLNAVVSGKNWVSGGRRDGIYNSGARHVEATDIAGSQPHLLIRESLHDAPTNERIKVAKTDVSVVRVRLVWTFHTLWSESSNENKISDAYEERALIGGRVD
jgi:hypothetical protein